MNRREGILNVVILVAAMLVWWQCVYWLIGNIALTSPPSRQRYGAASRLRASATARLRYACFRILPTAAVIAFQRTSSDSSCRRPAAVIS